MNKKILNICLSIAKNSIDLHPRKNNYKHYSFIIQNDKIVEWGTNRAMDSLKIFGYEEHQMMHSENFAYKRSKGLLDKNKDFEVINVRLNKNGNIKISKPCFHCFKYLRRLGCSKIWYTDKLGKFKKIILDL